MSDESTGGDGPGAVLADPRVATDHLRVVVSADSGPLLLLGVVHDHPASVYRVRSIVESLKPEVVAVELPRLALPLFATAGRDEADDSAAAGEMAAALATGTTVDARTAAIDTLGPRFGLNLARELRAESVSASVLRRVLGGLARVGGNAVACRVAAATGRTDGTTPASKQSFEYDVDDDAPPSELAAHERRQLSKSLSVLSALERPVADAVVDRARERTMARNLRALRESGGVVAVVGFDHLDDVTEHLDANAEWVGEPDDDVLAREWGNRA